MMPVKRFVHPKRGQFIQIQTSLLGETHPFSVSSYNEQTHELSISPKASGKFSAMLFNLKEGQNVLLDGPYGVFTNEIYLNPESPIVLIAGGIGITPFLSLFDYIKQYSEKFKDITLFYGNKTINDIGFRDRIESAANMKVVHVLSNETQNIGNFEQGYINSTLMQKYLTQDLKNYKFFICGPAIMMEKISADLLLKGVQKEQIFKEEFSF